MKKKIVFGFAGLMLALFAGNFIGNVETAKAGVTYYNLNRDCCDNSQAPVCCTNCQDKPYPC